MLYIFGGLPGTGKSELAKFLAKHISAVYLRIDTIEQALRDSGMSNLYDEAYQVAFKIAAENLRLGQVVVADSTNPVDSSRESWRNVATHAGVAYLEIEVICSDANTHQKRIAQRQSDITSLTLPSWQDVIEREYHPWNTEGVIIDTAGKTPTQSKHELTAALQIDR